MATAPLGYTVGARIHVGGLDLHMTLAYVGERTEAQLEELKEVIQRKAHWPIRLILGAHDNFGPNKDIPVVKCSFADHVVAGSWADFYQRYSELEPGMPPPKPELQNYHITVKKPGSRERLCAMDSVACAAIHLKRVGPHDPVFVIPVPMH